MRFARRSAGLEIRTGIMMIGIHNLRVAVTPLGSNQSDTFTRSEIDNGIRSLRRNVGGYLRQSAITCRKSADDPDS
jgi:hypothetical protein